MGLRETLVAQGVRPTGALGWLYAWAMPLLFRSEYAKRARLLELQPTDDVLDVACGSGVFLRTYGRRVRGLAGLDHSALQIRIARQLNRRRIAAGSAEIVQGDAAALPWGDATFSAVTSNSLGCFAEPEHALREMHRVLRPGGRLVLTVDLYLDEVSAARAQSRWGLPTWTPASLATALAAIGFADPDVSHDRGMTYARATKAPPG